MTVLGASINRVAVTFCVWAPRCRSVEVLVEGRGGVPMTLDGDGMFQAAVPALRAGSRYRYRLDGERARPDPASRSQPEGVHGPSEVVDPLAFPWSDQAFRGHDLADLVIYELHVGAFTGAGTFDAVIPHLDRLVDLGVTAVELMPVAEFPGGRNWGYDGVHLYAPQSTYGGPEGLRRLVDACHGRGLSVILDVVYNHLGPEGNYLAEYGPYFTDRVRTPWGPAVDFDGPGSAGVRRHVVENAREWVREFHVDGLRLDAIHAIHDGSPRHVLTELAEGVREEGRRLGRPVHVIAESHDNDRRIVQPAAEGGLGLDAVWSDDLHHALHARLTGERVGYYVDFDDPTSLPRALAEGFAFQGAPSRYWGFVRGTPSADLPGPRFVVYAQDHDLVGNRTGGHRLLTLAGPEAARLAAALVLVAPAVPLLFMGEEYGETAPFLFFASFLDPGLAEAVRRGRRADLHRFGWTGEIPDPGSPETLARSRLRPEMAATPTGRAASAYYRRWLALRRAHPALGARHKERTRAVLAHDGDLLVVERSAPLPAGGETSIRLLANLTGSPVSLAPDEAPRPEEVGAAGRDSPRPEDVLAAGWRLLLDSAAPEFGGAGVDRPLGPWQVLLYEAPR